MRSKLVDLPRAAAMIPDNCRLLAGGFLGIGGADLLIEQMIARGTCGLNLISADTGFPHRSTGRLISQRRVKTLLTTHIGANKNTVEQMNAGTLEVELIPQGTFTRRLHCGGNGLGGFLTKLGLGTDVERGKRIITVEGEDYLLELPLRGEVAIFGAYQVDRYGNCRLKGTGKNYNTVLATAADVVIVEADQIVECGELDPDGVDIPGIYIDYIVQGIPKQGAVSKE